MTGEGACASASFSCVNPDVCDQWDVSADSAGVCTIHVTAGDAEATKQVELSATRACPSEYTPEGGFATVAVGDCGDL